MRTIGDSLEKGRETEGKVRKGSVLENERTSRLATETEARPLTRKLSASGCRPGTILSAEFSVIVLKKYYHEDCQYVRLIELDLAKKVWTLYQVQTIIG